MSDAPIRVDDDRVVADGVYFRLPESEYHQALALSASGIKHLRISPLDWWARSPLNPEYRDEDTEAKVIGRAYHKRIIEGRGAFEARYAPALDPADYPEALRTNEDLIFALGALGAHASKATRKDALIASLQALDPGAQIWQVVAQAHSERHAGKTLLSGDLINRIEVASAMIEKHPDLGRAFTGGEPEVSIFWHDPETGVPCKARLDYLKPRAIVDLKSYENSYGLPIRKAIARQVANYRYHIQAAWYLEAAKQARRLIAEGRHIVPANAPRIDAESGLLPVRIVDSPGFTFLFVFQQKGIAPIATGMVLGPGSVMDIARMECEQARYTWARNWQTYGADPWMDVSEVATFDDSEFPAYLAE